MNGMDETTTNSTFSLIGSIKAKSRFEFWAKLVEGLGARQMIEIGVWQGEFAQYILERCDSVKKYYMLDPWRHLDDWNKPCNRDQDAMDNAYQGALRRTDFAKDRRVVLRGKTTEVINEVPDGSLDIAYIDGDHTLRGIAIDLIRTWPKVRFGGIVGGDDYEPSIWQHSREFEPTFVCPFAAYFAEAVGAPIIVLPFSQFVIVKPVEADSSFQLTDMTGKYGDRALLPQLKVTS
jgi:hypothetical protein